jgi:hypothetical protein
MNFQDCLKECCLNRDLVGEFNRLSGTNLTFIDTRAPITKMIDEATGYQKVLDERQHQDMQKFISFCFEFIWIPFLNTGVNNAT